MKPGGRAKDQAGVALPFLHSRPALQALTQLPCCARCAGLCADEAMDVQLHQAQAQCAQPGQTEQGQQEGEGGPSFSYLDLLSLIRCGSQSLRCAHTHTHTHVHTQRMQSHECTYMHTHTHAHTQHTRTTHAIT